MKRLELLKDVITTTAINRSFQSSSNLLARSPKKAVSGIYLKSFPFDDVTVHIKRVQDLYKEIPPKMKSLPILEDPDYALFGYYQKDPELLPKLYDALTFLTGPSDDNFDSFKGSFSFQFVLDVEKNKNKSQYLYWIMQYRSFLRVKLYQIVTKSDPRREEVLSKATESLFSKHDIETFSITFVEDVLRSVEKTHTPKPFILSSESECLIFGYINNQFFSTHYQNHKAYKTKLSELKSLLPHNHSYQ